MANLLMIYRCLRHLYPWRYLHFSAICAISANCTSAPLHPWRHLRYLRFGARMRYVLGKPEAVPALFGVRAFTAVRRRSPRFVTTRFKPAWPARPAPPASPALLCRPVPTCAACAALPACVVRHRVVKDYIETDHHSPNA